MKIGAATPLSPVSNSSLSVAKPRRRVRSSSFIKSAYLMSVAEVKCGIPLRFRMA